MRSSCGEQKNHVAASLAGHGHMIFMKGGTGIYRPFIISDERGFFKHGKT
jgi:hypothetical protein